MLVAAVLCGAAAGGTVRAQGAPRADDGADGVLRVCADPNNMPLSNNKGEGYENRIASQMASDFGYKLEYTYFPQRIGFVRHTLREKTPDTDRYKCDLIIGVPAGYDMTSTTRPYLHSTYAMVLAKRPELAGIAAPDDLLKLPPEQLHKLRIGVFTQTPAVDWLLGHGLIDQAVSYQVQSGGPQKYPGQMIEDDLRAGNVDVVFVWGPIAGYFAKRSGDGVTYTTSNAVSLPVRARRSADAHERPTTSAPRAVSERSIGTTTCCSGRRRRSPATRQGASARPTMPIAVLSLCVPAAARCGPTTMTLAPT